MEPTIVQVRTGLRAGRRNVPFYHLKSRLRAAACLIAALPVVVHAQQRELRTQTPNPQSMASTNASAPEQARDVNGVMDPRAANDLVRERTPIPWDCAGNVPPVAFIDAALAATVDEAVAFDAGDSVDPDGTIRTYHWDFDDGSTASGPVATHAFQEAGLYAVQLIVRDWCGAENTNMVFIDIAEDANDPDVPTLVINPTPAKALRPVAFEALVPASTDVLMYLWDYSDGGGGYGPTDTRTFNQAGVYSVVLTIYMLDGSIVTLQEQFTVEPGLHLTNFVGSTALQMPTGMAVNGGEVWTVGSPQHLATAFADDQNSGMWLAERSLSGTPIDVAVGDSIAAAAFWYNGVYLFDATTPGFLNPLERYSTYPSNGGPAMAVAVAGTLVYVGCGNQLQVLDASDPSAPVKVGTWSGATSWKKMQVVGSLLYASDGSLPGFKVFDISDPYNSDPTLVGQCQSTSVPMDLFVEGDQLALAQGLAGLQVFDISVPTQPTAIAHIPDTSGSGVRSAALLDGEVYAAVLTSVRRYDLANPANPVFIESAGAGQHIYHLRIHNGKIFASVSNGVVAVFQP